MAASSVAVSALPAAAATPTGTYGSGSLGPWSSGTRAISTDTQIRKVLDTNGVFMFGDSIAVQDGKSLAIRLAGRDGSQLAVHNWSGRPTVGAVDALAAWAGRFGLPRRILMATGTNDIFDPPKFAAQVERALSIVGPNRTVYWINIQVARKAVTATMQLADQRNSAWVNLQLSDAQKGHGNLRIVRWAEYLAVKPNRLASYLRDGLHTSIPLGQDARNELAVQALTGPR
ncbi:hypothetical protein AB0E69_02220 [Kribbella sp. NPDC026611]|uniref:hypothetical protein n=1 Tax=Kribbella sp. NPDC026611 TaxID=3154911 RepID=UPI0033ED7081